MINTELVDIPTLVRYMHLGIGFQMWVPSQKGIFMPCTSENPSFNT